MEDSFDMIATRAVIQAIEEAETAFDWEHEARVLVNRTFRQRLRKELARRNGQD